MKALAIVFVSLCLLLVVLLLKSDQTSIPKASYVAPEIDSQSVWLAVQEWRSSKGLQEYVESDLLCKYADVRIKQIQSNFSHDDFLASESAYLRNKRFSYIAENLSMEISSTKLLLSKWLDSPSHRENLENTFTDSCIRCNNNYCVQLFAR